MCDRAVVLTHPRCGDVEDAGDPPAFVHVVRDPQAHLPGRLRDVDRRDPLQDLLGVVHDDLD
jgi:hypothetical protein